MVRSVILPSQLLQSKMSLWWEVVSCQVNFLKVKCGHGEICYPTMSTSWNTMLPWWVILSWQVNFFKVRCCHGEKCYLAKSTFIVKMLSYLWYYVVMFWKIIWLSRQVEWHLYASIRNTLPHTGNKLNSPWWLANGQVSLIDRGLGVSWIRWLTNCPDSRVDCGYLGVSWINSTWWLANHGPGSRVDRGLVYNYTVMCFKNYNT